MSKLNGSVRVPHEYNRQSVFEIVRAFEDQVNRLAEGMISARHNSSTAAPTTGPHQRGDIVWNTQPTAGGMVWFVCVVAGEPGTWKAFGTIAP